MNLVRGVGSNELKIYFMSNYLVLFRALAKELNNRRCVDVKYVIYVNMVRSGITG